jgi:RHS repeat-associated protein
MIPYCFSYFISRATIFLAFWSARTDICLKNHIVLIGYQSGSAIFIGRHTCVRYRGYYYDTESGLYYLQSRYYDPETGRFISKDDPIFHESETGVAANLYAYCDNNPVNYTDHSGMIPLSVKIAIGIVGIAASVALTVASGGTLFPAILATLKFVAGSMAISMAIYGLIGYMQSGITGLKKGLLNGAADGFMWGGIGAAVKAAIAFIKVSKTIKNINQIFVKSKHLANASGGVR